MPDEGIGEETERLRFRRFGRGEVQAACLLRERLQQSNYFL
jgi:hypothetical protein